MFLSASPRDDFRAAEIATMNQEAANQGSRASFRASEILAQNAPSPSKVLKLLAAGAGIFLLYNFLKGQR